MNCSKLPGDDFARISESHAGFIDEGVRKVIAITTTAWWSVVGVAVADPVMAVAH